jgi:hypothetical protein
VQVQVQGKAGRGTRKAPTGHPSHRFDLKPGADAHTLPVRTDGRIPAGMTGSIDQIVARLNALELELEAELARKRAGLKYGLERGRARFEEEVVRRHRELRTHLARYMFRARPMVLITAPVIYSLIVPFAIVDLWASAYQAVCFRVYGIAQVQRHRYLVFDRSGLAYLNAIEKLNCAYCSYVNGVIAYVREIGARTEQYWCPIKQARRVIDAHARYAGFEEFGDGEHYHDRLKVLQADIRAAKDPEDPLTD